MRPAWLIFTISLFNLANAKIPCKDPDLPRLLKTKAITGVKPIQGDYLFMSETEVSNRQYRDYLTWLKKNDQAQYLLALPDTTRWREPLSYCEPFVIYYHSHPAYNDYPMVTVSQAQARMYCSWLHDRLKENPVFRKSGIDSFLVRLPTLNEWMKAARGGLDENAVYPWPDKGIMKEKGKYKGSRLLNCSTGNFDHVASSLNQSGIITTQVRSFWPNRFGLYHMSGNVAEWVAETGRSKGGSWNLPPYNARIDVPGYWDGDSSARSDIGFRYVIEVISLTPAFNPVSFNGKYFRKQFAYIPQPDSSKHIKYVSIHETTNAEFRTFLLETKTYKTWIHSNGWDSMFPYRIYRQYHTHPAFDPYPVVNISHDDALAYCRWLTDKFNNTSGRPHERVEFYLPDEKEWEWAARGGLKNSQFPWGGPFTRNSRGCYLANFCPLEEKYLYKTPASVEYHYPPEGPGISRGEDGSVIPARATSYFPNNYGLFNCSGNVAEMLDRPGVSKGGSWNSPNHKITLTSSESYTAPNPMTGFRVFMRVVEK